MVERTHANQRDECAEGLRAHHGGEDLMPRDQNEELAFPTDIYGHVPGMDLRDWFAGNAMPAIITSFYRTPAPAPAENPQIAEKIAELSYLVADAMLKERQK